MPISSTDHIGAARIAVVTVSYGSGGVLGDFLASLEHAASEPIAVIVVDNKPDDGDAVEHLARQAGAGYLRMGSNQGYGSAVNAAVESMPASVEWLIVSNPDLVMSPGSIDSMLSAAEGDPHIAAVGPATLDADGGVYPSARAIPSLRTGIGHALFVTFWPENPWTRAYKKGSSTGSGARDAGWLSGACLLLRRSTFAEIGGFDRGYFMYFEDVDLGYRLGKAGYRSVYEPKAQVTHTGAHSTNEDSARMIEAHHRSARRFLNRKYAGWWLWPVRVVLTVGLTARSALIRRNLDH